MRVFGNARLGEIEERRIDETSRLLDEVIAEHAHVHLEQMTDSSFALIVESKHQRACIMLGTKRAPVSAWVCWRENKAPKRKAKKQ